MSLSCIGLLGLDFAMLGPREAAAWIAARPPDHAFGYIVTPNADHLVRIGRRPALRLLYEAALLRLLDSRVVARAAHLCGFAVPPVCTGSDLTAELFRRHLRPGERITIIGSSAAEVRRLVERTGIAPPAHHEPPRGLEHDPQAMRTAVDFVLAHPARLVFLAVGSPRQEMLAAAVAATGRASGTGLCIGASLSFLAGTERRAPEWMQRSGLEWLHRLAREPLRLAPRYLLQSPRVLLMLLRAAASSPR